VSAAWEDDARSLSSAFGAVLDRGLPVHTALAGDDAGRRSATRDLVRTLVADGWADLISGASGPEETVAAARVLTQLGRVPTSPLAALTIGWLFPLAAGWGEEATRHVEHLARESGVTGWPACWASSMAGLEVTVGDAATVRVLADVAGIADPGEEGSVVWSGVSPDGETAHLVETSMAELAEDVVACPGLELGGDLLRVRGTRRPLRSRVVASLPRDEAAEVQQRAMVWWSVLQCAQAAGGTAELVGLVAEHLRNRRQFGVPLARFQVLRHRLADMYTTAENISAVLDEAARALGSGEPAAPTRVAAARLYAARRYLEAAESAIQCYGGMGFTWETGLHVWYRNAVAAATVAADLSPSRTLVVAELNRLGARR
jgi:hypothetical protein